ncbi:MAG: ABC transporter permease [Spirosomataceae bacterium]
MKAHPKTYVISKGIDNFSLRIYEAYTFLRQFVIEVFGKGFEFQELIKQCFEIGYKSLPLITLTGFITGMVFTKQSRPSLMEFGATSWLPSLVAIAIIRALAPLITSLISAGKVGSSIGAELASMRVTEQIDAMEVSAVNPFKFLIVTRVLATTITIPILSFYCAFVGLVGSFLDVTLNEETNLQAYFQNAFEQITFLDIGSALVKAVAYGFTIGAVGCYKGYYAEKGTQGVGHAANSSVVLSMFLIFLEEVAIVQVTNWFR